MSVFRDMERRIDEQLRKLLQSRGAQPDQRRELIEIQRGILEDVSDRAQLLPRARRVLPFNQISIRIPAPEPERKTAIRLVFIESGALAEEIKGHLRREQIEYPADLDVSVELLDELVPEIADKGYHLAFSTREAAGAPQSATPPPPQKAVRFTVITGLAEQPSFDVTKRRIHVGRRSEVLDDNRRLVRRNDVAFQDAGHEANATVSRAHAHIEYDHVSGEFRLFDDGSAYGTSVLQEGRLVGVPKAGVRGLRLSSGDEIYFGQARVRFEVL